MVGRRHTTGGAHVYFDNKLDLLPLRQRVKATGQAAFTFAKRELLDCLSKPEKFRITSYGEGGQILAASESALTQAQAVLTQAYGPLITFAEPTIHTYLDAARGSLMVPVMFLRVNARKEHSPALLAELKERNAEIQEVDAQQHHVVIRAQIRLSSLLGYEKIALELTDGSVHILCWLLRYEPASRRT